MSNTQRQAGFSIIEALLIVVIVAIAGFIGYYVYSANNKTTDTYNAASETSSTPVIKDKTPTQKNQPKATSKADAATKPTTSKDKQ